MTRELPREFSWDIIRCEHQITRPISAIRCAWHAYLGRRYGPTDGQTDGQTLLKRWDQEQRRR